VTQEPLAGVSSPTPDAAYGSDLGGPSRPGRRGRVREWRAVLELLRTAERGRGAVLLVDGRSGLGKTRLLDAAAEAAAHRGFAVARGSADEASELLPLSPLTSALGESVERLRTAGGPGVDPLDLRLWLVERLQDRLEERAARGPMLITLDDLHWADPTTSLAVRSLVPELSSYPLVWMLARTTGGAASGVDRLFDVLQRDGATRIVLGRLDDRAVAELIADVLGARPTTELLDLAAGAGGNPLILVELLRGLRDERALTVADGSARLASPRVPQRLQEIARDGLMRLSPPTRRVLQVAAVLGGAFSVDDLADLLGEAPTRLLRPLEEAQAAGIIEPSGDRFRFPHELLRRSAIRAIEPSVRRALHRQAGEMLLKRGDSAVIAAGHLMQYATPGDVQAVAGLDVAVRELLSSSPQTAADLAVRSLELTVGTDPGRFARTVTAVYALTTAGRLTEAIELARATPTRTAPPAEVARLRYELAYARYLAGQTTEVVTEAEKVLAQDGISDELRGLARNLLFRGLMAAHDHRSAHTRAETFLAGRTDDADPALISAHMLMSYGLLTQGRAADALGHIRDAVRIAGVLPIRSHRAYPRLQLAATLTGVGEIAEAETVLQTAAEEIATVGHPAFATGPTLFRARLRLVEGRYTDAAAEAEAGLATAEEMGAHAFSLVGYAVLMMIALRRGDLQAAAEQVARYIGRDEAGRGAMLLAPWAQWSIALVEEARGDLDAAVGRLRGLLTEEQELRWLLMAETDAAASLTRIALSSGDAGQARAVTDVAESLARDNDGFPSLTASAAHAHGVLHGDPEALARAAAGHAGPWNRASAAEDLGVALRRTDQDAAVEALDRALTGFQRIGAARDAARVRARLRGLGVRRRLSNQIVRPATGWESLTETECSIATLVAQGLTNPQVAGRMYVSPHTVKFHLRQVFAKLHVGSRVELARVAAAHTTADRPAGR
jgi:DNA-binding CsgD family transcriptional regulator